MVKNRRLLVCWSCSYSWWCQQGLVLLHLQSFLKKRDVFSCRHWFHNKTGIMESFPVHILSRLYWKAVTVPRIWSVTLKIKKRNGEHKSSAWAGYIWDGLLSLHPQEKAEQVMGSYHDGIDILAVHSLLYIKGMRYAHRYLSSVCLKGERGKIFLFFLGKTSRHR